MFVLSLQSRFHWNHVCLKWFSMCWNSIRSMNKSEYVPDDTRAMIDLVGYLLMICQYSFSLTVKIEKDYLRIQFFIIPRFFQRKGSIGHTFLNKVQFNSLRKKEWSTSRKSIDLPAILSVFLSPYYVELQSMMFPQLS